MAEPERPQVQAEHRQPGDFAAPRVATVSGVPIRLHWTFVLMLVWVVAVALSGGGPLLNRVRWLTFIAAVIGSVVLHELGHATVAHRFNIRVRNITLWPFGGAATMETAPRPAQELWIALAGPAVNAAISVVLAGVCVIARIPLVTSHPRPPVGQWLVDLLVVNVLLAALNLIPAFPMDGGRVLRALLARRLDESVATAIAARIGQMCAVGFAIYAIVAQNLLLAVIAGFVFLAAGQEASAHQTRVLTEGHPVSDAMLSEVTTLPAGATLGAAADALLAGSQHDFPVVNGEAVVGLLTRSDLMRGIAEEGPEGYVAGHMSREFDTAAPDDDLLALLDRSGGVHSGPVLVMSGTDTDTRRLVGMLTQENIVEFLVLTQLRRRSRPTAPAWPP